MGKIKFVVPNTAEEVEFFVLEETQISDVRYLLVAEEEEGDSTAYILKEIAADQEDAVYEMVEDDTELAAIGKIFAELMEDTAIEYEK
ncbi:MAG: DUF1292 domain-containing protein [Clostridiales bacterium]|nr:DUF1292 domain-containing protein [Clostridiales bacterium]